MFHSKTPERKRMVHTHKIVRSPNSANSSSLIYAECDYNSTMKNNTTMADSFSRNLKSAGKNPNFGKSFNSGGERSSRMFDDGRRTMSGSTVGFCTSPMSAKSPKSTTNANNKKRSLSSSLNYQPIKSNKIITNLKNFVATSPGVRTVVVRRHILPEKKTNFARRNINEANNKLHIRDRYPYDEYKIERNMPKDNLNNGIYKYNASLVKKLEGYICEIKSEGFDRIQNVISFLYRRNLMRK